MPTKAPPPIVPGCGRSGSFREPRPGKPDWPFWRDIPAPELWQLVALSCDIEPSECNAPDNRRINDLSDFLETDPAFTKRLAVAKANLDQFTPKVSRGNVDRWEIPVRQFVAFAMSKRTFKKLPAKFKSLRQPAARRGSAPKPDDSATANAIKVRAHGKTVKAVALKAKVIQLAQAHKSKDPTATRAILAQYVRHQMGFDGMKQLALSTIRQYIKGKV